MPIDFIGMLKFRADSMTTAWFLVSLWPLLFLEPKAQPSAFSALSWRKFYPIHFDIMNTLARGL